MRSSLVALFLFSSSLAFCQAWPGAVVTNSTIPYAMDHSLTTLSANITSSSTTITVASSSTFAAYEVINIDQEQIQICSVSTGILNVCVGGRGYFGTTAASHSLGVNVYGYVDAGYHNTMFTELASVENWLNTVGFKTTLFNTAFNTQYPTAVSTINAFTATGSGAVSRTVSSKLNERPSLYDFGATGNGSTDDTAAIQLALNSTGGMVSCLPGVYKVSSPILLSNGQGLQGTTNLEHYGFTSNGCTITPSSTFSGVSVIDVDPANISPSLPLTAGSFLQDVAVDMNNVNASSCTVEAIHIASESNTPIWRNVSVLNNDCMAVHITKSANSGASVSEGITFHNFYNYGKGIDTASGSTILIENANEITFTGGKVLVRSSSNPMTTSVGVTIQGQGNNYWFDQVSFAGFYTHVKVQTSGGVTPIHGRFTNCLHEVFNTGYSISGGSYPNQATEYQIVGPIMETPVLTSPTAVHLMSGSAFATVLVNDSDISNTPVVLDSGANGNTVLSDNITMVTNSGSQNAIMGREYSTGYWHYNTPVRINSTDSSSAVLAITGQSNFVGVHTQTGGMTIVKTTPSGASANVNSLVVEDNNATYWHHLLNSDAVDFGILFGSPSLSAGPQIDYEYSLSRLQIAMPAGQYFRIASPRTVISTSSSDTGDGSSVLSVTGTTDSTSYKANGTAGVTCSGTPTSSFATVNGIVTHC